MYDSRSDNVAARLAHKHDSLRTWNEYPWAGDPRGADRIAAIHHDNVWANRANAEHGEGDRIEYSTPKSRVLCTPQAERAAIAEGLDEYRTEVEEGPAGYRLCFCGLHLETDDFWLLGFVPDSTC